jgi:NTP pyrophosphatase (non-canonical NTP hydrolase)
VIDGGHLEARALQLRADEVDREKLKDELADVLYSALLLAETYGLDVAEVVRAKLRKNEARYPVEKFKGSREKGE